MGMTTKLAAIIDRVVGYDNAYIRQDIYSNDQAYFKLSYQIHRLGQRVFFISAFFRYLRKLPIPSSDFVHHPVHPSIVTISYPLHFKSTIELSTTSTSSI